MSTLISVYNSDGCVGRCDAKCYNATCTDCDCICGGKNHGAGIKQAQENTRQMGDKWIKEYIDRKGVQDGKGEINQEIYQLKLF